MAPTIAQDSNRTDSYLPLARISEEQDNGYYEEKQGGSDTDTDTLLASNSSDIDEKDEATIQDLERVIRQLKTTVRALVIAFALTIALISACAIYKLLRPPQLPGIDTEFHTARSVISTVKSRANGRILFDRASHSVSFAPRSDTRLFAPPSREVDAGWEEIMKHEFFLLHPDEEEAIDRQLTQETDYISPNASLPDPDAKFLVRERTSGSYMSGLSVYHSMHCLNFIRRSMHENYYGNDSLHLGSFAPNGWNDVHLEHCFENVLHAIQCASDLTPVPAWGWPGMRIRLGVTMEKTCRDFSKVKDWVGERFENQKKDQKAQKNRAGKGKGKGKGKEQFRRPKGIDQSA